MSAHELVSLPPYQSLLDDGLTWSSQSFGDAENRAIAFRPRSKMPPLQFARSLERIRNLFASYDPRPRNPPPKDMPTLRGEYPAPPEIKWTFDIPYLNMPTDRLRATLVNYFESTLPRHLGKSVETMRDDDIDVDFVYDAAKVSKLAARAADHFIEHEVTTNCFMPNEDRYAPEEHHVGVPRPKSVSHVEKLVDAVV